MSQICNITLTNFVVQIENVKEINKILEYRETDELKVLIKDLDTMRGLAVASKLRPSL